MLDIERNKHIIICVLISLCGGVRGRVIPSSIPNLEVKPPIADNTAGYVCGNVGRCRIEVILTLTFLIYVFIFLFIIFFLFYLLLILFIKLFYCYLLIYVLNVAIM